MSVIKRNRWLLTLGVLLAVGVLLIGDISVRRAQALSDGTYQELETFAKVVSIVKKNYVKPVTTKELVQDAITGMLASLDPHSAYLTPDLYRDLEVETRGSFGGLGIEITIKHGVLTVVAPIEDTPAYRAGIKANDEIIKINDAYTRDMRLTDAVKLMRGPKGSTVTLTIHRAGVPEMFAVAIKRDIIRIRSVKSKSLKNGLSYIRITTFEEGTGQSLSRAINKAQDSHHGRIKGLVLDLRDNPGGLLNQAIEVSNEFLNGGLIVYTQGRLPSQQQKFFAHVKKNFTFYPMVVLINGGTASASEIVAGALQDQHRAIVEGTQSFGKGSVQTILPLDDHAALRLTTARYYTPNGRSIQAVGITPDVKVEPPKLTLAQILAEPDTSLETNPEVREDELLHHFKNGQPGSPSKPSGNSNTTPAEPSKTAPGGGASLNHKPVAAGGHEVKPADDPQLQRAIYILDHWSKYAALLKGNHTSTKVAANARP